MLATICRYFAVGMRRVDSVLFDRRRFAMAILCIIMSAGFTAHAWTFPGLVDRLDGPSRDDIEVTFLSWRYYESSSKNSFKNPYAPGPFLIMTLRIRNKSSYFLNYIDYGCALFDAAGNRIAKHIEATGGFSEPSLRPGGIAEWEFRFSLGRAKDVRAKKCEIADLHGSN